MSDHTSVILQAIVLEGLLLAIFVLVLRKLR